MRKLLCSLCFAGGLFALVTPTATSDVSGDAAAHQVASSGTAVWIQFTAPSTNTSAVRVGGSDVSTAKGTPIAPGGGFLLPPIPRSSTFGTDHLYDLTTWYYVVQTGDKLSIVRANP